MKAQKPVILYLDDVEENLTTFSIAFFDYYKILKARTTTEAKKILAENPVQVILSDQVLKEAGEDTRGTRFFESVVSEYPHPIRMLLTGYSDIADAMDAINKGRVFRYITKPYEEDDVKLIIDGAVKLFQAEEQYRLLLGTLEEKIKERTERLMKLNAEKNEFLGIVAHDLKNPLGSMRMLAELINHEAGTFTKEEIEEYSNDIVTEADRMFTLITNLLDVNKIERGFAVNTIKLDIVSITQAIAEGYMERAAVKGLKLNFEAKTSPVFVMADEVAAMQVIDNIVSNAVKYSPNGENKNIWVRVVESNKAYRIEVQDEGPGLTDADKDKLFGHFARLSAQPTGGEHSTGLGLSIVKKMVEAMNGKIWCESEKGKGATFIVELPGA
jgi:two-component system sensor histidine kinase/response regulator